jgi:Tol biopolymer transport system component
VLYEVLARRPAFPGHTAADILAAVLGGEPDWPALPASTPFPITQLLRRCLQKDRSRRPRDIADVRLEIEQVLEAADDERSAAGGRESRRTPWPFVFALAAFAVVVGVSIVAPPWPSRPAETMRAETLTTFRGSERFPSLSPDGNYMTFMWTGPGEDNADIYVQQIGAGNPLRLTFDARSDYNPVWSPNGKWVALLRAERIPAPSEPAGRSELLLIPPLGGAERKLGDLRVRVVGTPAFLAWCPDSACVIATHSLGDGRPDALFAFPLGGGEPRQLTSPPPDVAGDCNPAVSPDGVSLVFRRVPAANAGELYWMPFGDSGNAEAQLKRLTPAALDGAYPSWVPGGKEIVFAGRGTLWRLSPFGEGRPTPLQLMGEHGVMPAIGQARPANVTRLVYVHSVADSNIWALSSPEGDAFTRVSPRAAISSTRADLVGAFSPDGRRVVFASNRSGEFEIWTADPDGANAIPVSAMGSAMTSSPAWSPDGSSIAFQSNMESQFDIYVTSAGGGKPRRLTVGPASDTVPRFSRDGRWIYFASDPPANSTSGEYQVWKIPAAGGSAVQVTAHGGYKAIEGRDGSFVYYTQAPARAPLWRIPSAGGTAVRLLDEVIAFDVVENGIYYTNESAGQARLQFLDFATNRSSIVAEDLGRIQPFLAVAPDRRTILYSRVDSSGDDLMLVNNFR